MTTRSLTRRVWAVTSAYAVLVAFACDDSSGSKRARGDPDSSADGSAAASGGAGMGAAAGEAGLAGASAGSGGTSGRAGSGGVGAEGGFAGAVGGDSGTRDATPDAPDGEVGPPDAASDAFADAQAETTVDSGSDGDAPSEAAADAGPVCVSDTGAPVLVAHWAAEGDLVDSVGGHDGSAVGTVTFVSSPPGQAIHVDPPSYVSIPWSPSLDLATYTVSGWIRVPSGVDQWGTLITKENGSIGDPWNDRNFGLFVNSSTGNCPVGFASALHTGASLCSTFAVHDGGWHHLAATFDGCTLRLYVDGIQDGSLTGPPPALGPTQSIKLGSWLTGGTADLDAIRLHSGAVDAATIAMLASGT